MNKYGRMAIRHWEKTDPDRFQQIPERDRETFFTELGERAEMEIQQLQDQLAGPDPAGESYLEKVGRLNMARLQAEERVLPELILVPPPSSSEQDEGNESARWHLAASSRRSRPGFSTIGLRLSRTSTRKRRLPSALATSCRSRHKIPDVKTWAMSTTLSG
jgi:hypothetical protein